MTEDVSNATGKRIVKISLAKVRSSEKLTQLEQKTTTTTISLLKESSVILRDF